jgi:AbrB family looped-hinge helix DNA binding protein
MKDIHSYDKVDMVTLGERGQVVIPQAIREQIGLKAGDKLMVVVKHGKMIGLLPPDCFRGMVESLARQLDEVDALDNQTNNPKGA